VVQDIAAQSENIVAGATAFQEVLATFSPTDAAKLQPAIATIITDGNLINTLANNYLTAPSATLLTQISSILDTLATTESSALLAALDIKDANSLKIAQAVLSGIAAGVVILGIYLTSINVSVSASTTKTINGLIPYTSKPVLVSELNKAKDQGLVPQYTTIQSLGF
jgi:hypothetical protein